MLLTPMEVAERLRLSVDQVYSLVRQGVMPGAVRIGRSVRIDEDKLSAWIAGGGAGWAGGWRKAAQ